MNIHNILEEVQGPVKNVRKLDVVKDVQYLGDKSHFDKCCDIIRAAGGSPTNLLITDSVLNNIIYAEPEVGLYLTFLDFNDRNFEDVFAKLSLARIRQMQLLEQKDYSLFYFYIPTCMRIFDFERRYLDIPEDMVAEVWVENIYTALNYGFSNHDKQIVDYVMARSKRRKGIKSLIIYRGEGTKSTPTEQAYSWTTDLNIALWFAARGVGKRVLKADALIEDIAFFVDNRNEHEIIIAPDKVQNIKALDMIQADMDTLIELLGNIIGECVNYKDLLVDLYAEIDDRTTLHGSSHVARVLLLALIIADLEDIREKTDRVMIIMAAILHDCGRITDGEDAEHGLKSAERAKKFITYFSEKERQMLYLVIKNHSLSDELGRKDLTSFFKGEDRVRAIRLYNILKDADGLDRVRLGLYRSEFNYTFLRLQSSRRLPLVAAALYHEKAEDLLLKL